MKHRKNTKISDQLGILEKVGAIWPQLQAVRPRPGRPRPGRPASRFGQMASGQSHTDTYIILHAKMHSNVQHATVGSKRARTQGLRRFHLVLPLRLVTSSIQTPHHSTNERTTSGMAIEWIESDATRPHETHDKYRQPSRSDQERSRSKSVHRRVKLAPGRGRPACK